MQPLKCLTTLLLATLACHPDVQAQTRPSLSESLEARVLVPPAIVRIAGRDQLAYELHLTNLRRSPVSLEGLVVRSSRMTAPLLALRGAQIEPRIGHPASAAADPRQLQPGARAVLYFWMPVDPKAATSGKLWHQIEFDVITASGRERVTMEDEGVELQRVAPLVLDPPLRGGPWAAVYDPMLERGHRTVIYTLNGRARIPGRFAIDWFKLAADGTHARAEGSKNKDWYGYESEVLAVADAMVAEVRDDIEDDDRTGAERRVPLQEESGNYVALDLGAGRFAIYEHLRRGSVRVRAGDRVTRGQVIGNLGNSGSSSSGPHLHFHVSDAASVLGAEGMPYALRCFNVKGGYAEIGGFISNTVWRAVPESEGGERRGELPAPNVVVDFGACR